LPKPTPQEYQTAIQHPNLFFHDVELKKGTPELNNLQLPKTISGTFASVFQVNCGSKIYAVRCFLRDSPNREKRYKAIDDYLNKVNLPYMIKFDYLEKGILMNGNWLPIIKMEWIEGYTLDKYVDMNINNSERIEKIAEKFKQMVSDLKMNSISHCDLHHGNMMIINDDIRLLDYDAMYVPTLKGLDCSEWGHPNYQHPFRDLGDFNPTVDNFSEWVIYLSLVALSKKPQLWAQLKGGDECLLFRKSDFGNPSSSPVFNLLERIIDDTFKTQLQIFQSSIYNYDLTNIPSLNDKVESLISPFNAHLGGLEERGPIGQIDKYGEESSFAINSSWIWENKEVILTNSIGEGSKERVISRLTCVLLGVVFGLYFLNIIVPVILIACISCILSVPIYLYGKYYIINPRVLEKQSLRIRLNDVINNKPKIQVKYEAAMRAKRERYNEVIENINKTDDIRARARIKKTFVNIAKQHNDIIQSHKDSLLKMVWNEGKINHELKSYSEISLTTYIINIMKNIL